MWKLNWQLQYFTLDKSGTYRERERRPIKWKALKAAIDICKATAQCGQPAAGRTHNDTMGKLANGEERERERRSDKPASAWQKSPK